jgi:lia operon protein LiaF
MKWRFLVNGQCLQGACAFRMKKGGITLFKSRTDYVASILIIGVILLLLEISFFNSGLIFSLVFSAFMIYFGRKKWSSTLGKILFWIGVVSAAGAILSMMAFKFFLFAILLLVIFQFVQRKKNPHFFNPEFGTDVASQNPEQVWKKPLFFQNMLFGRQKTPESVYEWNDVNIQGGVGDTMIDISNTVLPKGENVICVRNILGNVQIYVPYETEVKIVHSTILGSSKIFDQHDPQLFNQNLQYQTSGYDDAEQKIKIVTSLMVGSLEVKRI